MKNGQINARAYMNEKWPNKCVISYKMIVGEIFYPDDKHPRKKLKCDVCKISYSNKSYKNFRTMDVVGLDTAVNVSNNLLNDLKNDESVSMFSLPKSVKKLYENKQWGDKTGMGFYKKEVDEKGKKTFYEINLKTHNYETYQNTDNKELLDIKKEESLDNRIIKLISLTSKYGDFYRSIFYDSFRY